jgi:ectoine hydroxylase-related dioxygenase (phytanoyl-CoA dioxygenase family)
MNKSRFLLNKLGYYIHKLTNDKFVKASQKIITNSGHSNITSDSFFDRKTLTLQKKLFLKSIHINIIKNEENFFKKILNIRSLDELSVTSFFHLRAVKKKNKHINNFVGLHRETFYSEHKYTKHQINVSVPILNYTKKNSMKLVQGTHKISDSKIKLKKIDSRTSGIEKGSIKHKLGLPYNPKLIISGVNCNKAKRINCQPGKIIVFSAMLIHGGGSNNTRNPRYSIDFALIKKKFIKNKKIKDYHISYSKNKKYWIDIPKI